MIPDTLVVDYGVAAGFPNGRLLPDPVIDVTLAVVLLDFSVHTPFDLVGLSQDQDDGLLLSSFPFLAEPN